MKAQARVVARPSREQEWRSPVGAAEAVVGKAAAEEVRDLPAVVWQLREEAEP